MRFWSEWISDKLIYGVTSLSVVAGGAIAVEAVRPSGISLDSAFDYKGVGTAILFGLPLGILGIREIAGGVRNYLISREFEKMARESESLLFYRKLIDDAYADSRDE